MPNNQQKAQQYVDAFQEWSVSMTDDGYRQIVTRGCLNRGEVAKAVGCGRAALGQNPRLKELLTKLEEGLRLKGVLPSPASQETQERVKPHDQQANKRDMNAARLQELEQKVIALEAENRELRAKLSRFSELSQVLSELGRLP